MKINYKLAYPLQLASLSAYVLFGFFNANLVRAGLVQWGLSVLSGLVTTYLINSFLKERKLNNFSAYISSTAVYLLCTSLSWYIHIIVSAIAVFTKVLVTNGKGNHVFNPAGFGMLISICLFPTMVTLDTMQFIDSYELLGLILTMGFSVVFLSNRLVLSLSYILGFIIAAAIRSYILPESFIFFFLPLFNPMNLIFLFHMISDPMTSPKSYKGQIVFGLSIALLDHFLRHNWVMFPTLISLMIMTALFFLYNGEVWLKLKTSEISA